MLFLFGFSLTSDRDVLVVFVFEGYVLDVLDYFKGGFLITRVGDDSIRKSFLGLNEEEITAFSQMAVKEN